MGVKGSLSLPFGTPFPFLLLSSSSAGLGLLSLLEPGKFPLMGLQVTHPWWEPYGTFPNPCQSSKSRGGGELAWG